MLVNVRGYYEPVRQMIKQGMQDGFITAINEHIITFVDGPSSITEHDDFDWGLATLEALDAWKWEGGKPLFNWSQPGASEGEKLKAT